MSGDGHHIRRRPGTFLPLFNISRRGFLIGAGAGALTLAIGGCKGLTEPESEPERLYGGDNMPGGLKDSPLAFISIAADGTVTVINPRAEMGQGIRTSVPMIIADELDAEWARVKVIQAVGDHARYGNQNTDGSRSIRHGFTSFRRAGAAAKQMLISAAAAAWGVPVAEIIAERHQLRHAASGRSADYGEFAAAAAALPVPDTRTVPLKPWSQLRYIGRDDIALIDNQDIVTGRAVYGTDVRFDNMAYAVVARPPVYGGRLRRANIDTALAHPGVIAVHTLETPPSPPPLFLPLGGVAVIAENTWAAMEGRRKLELEWDDGDNAGYDSDAYDRQLTAAIQQPGKRVYEHGDVESALRDAPTTIAVEYHMPHIAHATIEPPAATAQIVDGKVTVWACVQDPQSSRDLAAQLLGMSSDDVTVYQTLLGGGFGRKSKPDFVGEAALLSHHLGGRPVKVMWTREDDLAHDYLHAVSVQRVEAAADAEGRPLALLHRVAAPTISSTFGPDSGYEAPFELTMGLTDLPTSLPHYRIENTQAMAHARIGWFRSVYNIPHAFATQCAIAELAHAAGRDPKDFLLEVIGPAQKIDPRVRGATNYDENPALYPLDTGRLRRVAETVATAANWGRPLPTGHGLGIAAHRSFVSYTAAVVEVAVDEDGRWRVVAVDIAIDCGAQINPERVRSQLEGTVIQGIGIVQGSAITFRNGRVEQGNYHQFILPRMPDAPLVIRVHAVGADDTEVSLGGVGEPGLPPIAPALANAIFAASGQRIRRLPVGDRVGTG